ncbi:MAG: hypothetical protein FJ221_09100 [Lentisphaerae bacterium]|nr:hypothetical protein [Lentisphaerota bacterium]
MPASRHDAGMSRTTSVLRILPLLAAASMGAALPTSAAPSLADAFRAPPDAARPWVYWYFMDGNLTREGMTADLEAMKRAGIGGALFLEVNVGVPRGPVEFMSPEWRELFRHAAKETERLGLEFAVGTGPGWCGSGGPWVKPEQSMQHLVAAATNVAGPATLDALLPRPAPRTPFFGERTLTPDLKRLWQDFYRDVAVLAFPAPGGDARVSDADEKALYHRAPFSSQPGVKAYLPDPAAAPDVPAAQCIARNGIVDLTGRLRSDGRLAWDVPPGSWTILRFGRTITGQTTRPAPQPGLGLETDKFNRDAVVAHFRTFTATLLDAIGPRLTPGAGLTTLHFDSWEMSSQNWSESFRSDFRRLRGYDPLPFLPAFDGRVVDSPSVTERFLWDLRQTAQQMVVENHTSVLQSLARRHGLKFSIEPYDMNPCADLFLGAAADIPQCEFWSRDHGFKTAYSCIEAASIAHTMGRPVVAAEAFTATSGEDWRLHPGALKAQTDWAFCIGINRIIFHTFQHQPWLDRWPGMAMGPYGVHWQRTQPWWDMSLAYHRYIARCQHMLSRGTPVADILYLVPEGAPHVFRPPADALAGDDWMPDRRGHAFDGCDPAALAVRAKVRDGRIAFSGGAAYSILVLPETESMTPALLAKVKSLLEDGATVMGPRPLASPSLSGYPACDDRVRKLADELWGTAEITAPTKRGIGRGLLVAMPRTLPTPPAAPVVKRLPGAEARWIWSAGGDAMTAPPCTRRFRRTFVVAAGESVTAAWLTMSADNSFTAFVNGRKTGEGANFHHAVAMDVTARVRPGTNTIEVAVVNGGDAANPAGLIGTLDLEFSGGARRAISTDASWEAAEKPAGPWAAARALGAAGMAPWGELQPAVSTATPPPPYVDYETTVRVLAARGVPPDFESDVPLRYIHRRVDGSDLYFVANPAPERIEATCLFRADTPHAALWDAAAGRIAATDRAAGPDGRSRVTLALEPHASVFVVFTQKPEPAAAAVGTLHPQLKPVTTLSGPWEISFQPGRGAPERATLPSLSPLNEHADEGIRHFSGIAAYRKTFKVSGVECRVPVAPPAAAPTPGASAPPRPSPPAPRLFLDLGRVEVMARVRLNGTDLGVVWTTPMQVDATDALREGENELEIEVANLWPNRLIGDQALPEEKRISWTTWNPYKKDSPLLPSGLLGPVRILQSAP